MKQPHILVIEDNPDLRTEIVDYLTFCHYQAIGIGSVAQLHSTLAERTVDILLLDITLPDGDGLEVARTLRAKYGLHLGIIMVTARGHVHERIEGLSAGADAYLVKPINLQELKMTIDRLACRLTDSAPEPAAEQLWQLDQQALQLICPDTRRVSLTVTESRLLNLLLNQPGKAITRSQLCECLPPGSNKEDTRRLDSILSRLRHKAERDAGVRLPIHTLRNQGYVFAGNRRASDRR